jgi:hypothetical protein
VRNPTTLPRAEREEIAKVGGVLRRYLDPELSLQNFVVNGPGEKKVKKQSLAEIDLAFQVDGMFILVEVGSNKHDKARTLSKKFYYLSKLKDRRFDFSETCFLEFNGGNIRGIDVGHYNELKIPDVMDVLIGLGSKETVEELSYRQLEEALERLKMKPDIPITYFERALSFRQSSGSVDYNHSDNSYNNGNLS